jgi:hypothetical protein
MIPNRGDAHGYEHGTAVSLHLPREDLRVLRTEPSDRPVKEAQPTPTSSQLGR